MVIVLAVGAMLMGRFTRPDNIAMGVMLVVMVMGIQGNLRLERSTKEREISWIVGDRLRMSFTAHVLVKTNDRVCSSHDQMQIVRHQQHATLSLFADVVDQTVQRCLSSNIHALYRFIQNQQLWITQQCPRQ